MITCDICNNKAELVFKKYNYDFMYCKQCDLLFADVEENNTKKLYREKYYTDVYPDYESDEKIHYLNSNLILKSIEKNIKKGTLLEIGSAFGFFIKAALKRGWNATGIEISEYSSKLAQYKYKVNIINDDFLKCDISDRFNAVCILDTIEHLYKPSLYIDKVSNIINKNGILAITTGDRKSGLGNYCGKYWRMILPPEHIYYYSKYSINKLLSTHGFKIVSITNTYKYQNIGSIFQYLFNINKRFFPILPIPINMGDIMLVLAKKI